MAKKPTKGPSRIAGKQIRRQVRSLKGDVQDVKKGMSKQVKRATKSMAKQNNAIKAQLTKMAKKTNAPAKTVTKTKIVVRKVPKIVIKKVPKIVVRRVPKVVVRKVPIYSPPQSKAVAGPSKESLDTIMKELSSLKTELNTMEKEARPMPRVAKSIAKPSMNMSEELPAEEVAVRLTKLYFEEIARLGFKRRLDFDAIINAYYYCLQRLQNRDKELEVMRKIVEREEAKLPHEAKAQLFPSMQE